MTEKRRAARSAAGPRLQFFPKVFLLPRGPSISFRDSDFRFSRSFNCVRVGLLAGVGAKPPLGAEIWPSQGLLGLDSSGVTGGKSEIRARVLFDGTIQSTAPKDRTKGKFRKGGRSGDSRTPARSHSIGPPCAMADTHTDAVNAELGQAPDSIGNWENRGDTPFDIQREPQSLLVRGFRAGTPAASTGRLFGFIFHNA